MVRRSDHEVGGPARLGVRIRGQAASGMDKIGAAAAQLPTAWGGRALGTRGRAREVTVGNRSVKVFSNKKKETVRNHIYARSIISRIMHHIEVTLQKYAQTINISSAEQPDIRICALLSTSNSIISDIKVVFSLL